MAFSSDSVQVFLAALDHGSFSAAARALSRVPSAVSMTIAHLEAELDVQLFDRSGREPRPTAAARALEPQARLLAGQLALVFERPSIDGREGFQEVGTETLVAVMAPDHAVLQGARASALARGEPPERAMLREEHLTTTRQIVVASRD